ncbi:CHAP domain-containing protein [Enterococcus avium]|uniref:CHAP domain-containing protein n=1 Tax=Enterococcus avium TaxID=33945 RepID=UPI00159D4388|nr:CHAP domain-containing protein [Enterococcus avium]NVN78881.1 CHAP domain-containing protein [Enterococcus avium]
MSIYEKGLNYLKSLIGQPVGNYQCYAVAAIYSGIMNGPDLGAGTVYNQLEIVGDIYSASEIGNAYPWDKYGWSVTQKPEYDQLKIGAILCYERGIDLSDSFTTHEYYGHCAVICGLEDGRIQTYEQKGEQGEIVAEYNREFLGMETIASVIMMPDFDGEPTDFIHGQAPMEDAGKE